MKKLFDEVKLNRLELRNRIFRSATWEALADDAGNLTAPLYEIAVKNSLPELKIILVGGHRSFEQMTKILNETAIEILSLSRPLIREPNLINRWRSGDLKPSACISCNACYGTPAHKCIITRGKLPDKKAELISGIQKITNEVGEENLRYYLDSVRIAGYIGESREKMLEVLQYSIDTIDEEKFAKTFRRDHI